MRARTERRRTTTLPLVEHPPHPRQFTRPARQIHTAVLLAIGSELTVGETRDTNSGDLARSLSREGVDVLWTTALPDREATVVAALHGALAAADLVVTTGGLGPTPDDLTREAIAAAVREQPAVDPELERWLRHLFERRAIPFPATNMKQAWLIPSSTAIPNDRGTAPGWWVDQPDGRVIVALPGPPREMTPMWDGWVIPHLRGRGLGQERLTRTYRLTGIGESTVAALLGEPLLRAANPIVATYARADAVDVRISAVAEAGRLASAILEEAAAAVVALVGGYVWGRDTDTWAVALGREIEARGLTLALLEVGTGGSALALLGEASWLASARSVAVGSAEDGDAVAIARSLRDETGASIGLAVRAVESGEDTQVAIAAVGPWGQAETSQTAFLGGSEGRRRAGIAAVAFLHDILRDQPTRG